MWAEAQALPPDVVHRVLSYLKLEANAILHEINNNELQSVIFPQLLQNSAIFPTFFHIFGVTMRIFDAAISRGVSKSTTQKKAVRLHYEGGLSF